MRWTLKQHRWLVCGWLALAASGLVCHAAYLPKPKKDKDARKPFITFSVPGGAYSTNLMLSLSAVDGSAIRFTLDGSEPKATSALYSAPLAITNTLVVRARTFAKDGTPGRIAAEAYTLLDPDLAEFSSNLPLIIVDSLGTNIVHEWKIQGALHAFDGGKDRTRLSGPPNVSKRCLVNIRGRASLRYPKNSLTLKLIDGAGEPEDAAVLGFPEDSDWILYAPYPDKTLMRDFLAYELHGQMGHWAPGAKFVEVFINRGGRRLTRGDYAGVYLLEERIKRSKRRVNIAKLKPEHSKEPEITGGYIFKKDHVDSAAGPVGGDVGGGYGGPGIASSSTRLGYPTGPGGFPADPKGFQPPSRVSRSSSRSSSSSGRVYTNHFGFLFTMSEEATAGTAFRDPYEESAKDEEGFKTTLATNQFYFVEPEPDEITSVQKVWLRNHLNEFEAALYGPDFAHPTKGYQAYIDVGSFIDYHLISEATKNVDAFRFSVFFHKDRGGKIKADPIWDWNLSFGNANGKQGWMPELWLWPQLDNKEYSWYRRLFEDPDFGQRYVDRWAQLRADTFSTKRLRARIDELARLLNEAQQRNFEKWPIMGRPINPNYHLGATYEEEIDLLTNFITARLDWIEKQFPPMPQMTTGPNSTQILSARSGEILFTLDGTDPRAPGGAVATTARRYDKPFSLDRGAKVLARVREDNRWSGLFIHSE
jgi:hypothetical protein